MIVWISALMLAGTNGLRIKQVEKEHHGIASLYNGLASGYNHYVFEDPDSREEVQFTAQKKMQDSADLSNRDLLTKRDLSAGESSSPSPSPCLGYVNPKRCADDSECDIKILGWYSGDDIPVGTCMPAAYKGQCALNYWVNVTQVPCECITGSKGCAARDGCVWSMSGGGTCTTHCLYQHGFYKGVGDRATWKSACENDALCEFCNSSYEPRCEPKEYCQCMQYDGDPEGCKAATDESGLKAACQWGWNGDPVGCYSHREILHGSALLCYDAGVSASNPVCRGMTFLWDTVGIGTAVNVAQGLLSSSQGAQVEDNVKATIVAGGRAADRIQRRYGIGRRRRRTRRRARLGGGSR